LQTPPDEVGAECESDHYFEKLNDQFCSGHFASFHSPEEREAEARLRTGVTNPSRSLCAASFDHLVGQREQAGNFSR
jgi:hypothetical protein